MVYEIFLLVRQRLEAPGLELITGIPNVPLGRLEGVVGPESKLLHLLVGGVPCSPRAQQSPHGGQVVRAGP